MAPGRSLLRKVLRESIEFHEPDARRRRGKLVTQLITDVITGKFRVSATELSIRVTDVPVMLPCGGGSRYRRLKVSAKRYNICTDRKLLLQAASERAETVEIAELNYGTTEIVLMRENFITSEPCMEEISFVRREQETFEILFLTE